MRKMTKDDKVSQQKGLACANVEGEEGNHVIAPPRDGAGRLLPGIPRPGFGGRKPKATEQQQAEVMDKIMPPDDFWALVAGYLAQKTHAYWAAPLWARYRFSEPPKRVETEELRFSFTLRDLVAVRDALAGADLAAMALQDADMPTLLPSGCIVNEERKAEGGDST